MAITLQDAETARPTRVAKQTIPRCPLANHARDDRSRVEADAQRDRAQLWFGRVDERLRRACTAARAKRATRAAWSSGCAPITQAQAQHPSSFISMRLPTIECDDAKTEVSRASMRSLNCSAESLDVLYLCEDMF